jgi:hypothetical protein
MAGVWITSPLPLNDDAKLRFQVLDNRKNEALQTLTDWGWEPRFVQILPRIDAASFKVIPAAIYEIDLPKERQSVPDGKIFGEVYSPEEKKAAAAFIATYRKAIGLKP